MPGMAKTGASTPWAQRRKAGRDVGRQILPVKPPRSAPDLAMPAWNLALPSSPLRLEHAPQLPLFATISCREHHGSLTTALVRLAQRNTNVF